MWVIWLLLFGLFAFIVIKVKRKFKTLSPLGTITVCTGAVKTGKSTLAVHLALRSYRKVLFMWKIQHLFDKSIPKPLLYSNIPLAMDYVPVTTDILLRKTRTVPKSVMLLDEASLVADSQLIKDGVINNRLLLFFKLYGHSTHGGTIVLDTQSLSDLHYSIRRCCNQYLYITRTAKFVPFFLIMDVIEQRYSDDGTVIAAQTDDVQDNVKHVLVPKRTWRYFDTYCYSVLTDDKPIDARVVDGSAGSLKTIHIPSFRNWKEDK